MKEGELPVLSLVVWLAAVFAGVEYGTPAWNAHSVPPPQLY